MEFVFFLLGLIIYLFIAHVFTGFLLCQIRKSLSISCNDPDYQIIKAWIVGSIERVFFMLCTTFELSGLIIGIIAWITIKSAVNHQQLLKGSKVPPIEIRKAAFSSLLGSLISMLFAIGGGLIILHWGIEILSFLKFDK